MLKNFSDSYGKASEAGRSNPAFLLEARGGGTRGEIFKGVKNAGFEFGIRLQGGQRNGRREMRRFAPELHVHEVAIPRGDSRLDHGLDVALPVGTAGDDKRTYAGKSPVLVRHKFALGSAAPAMVLNFQIEVRRVREDRIRR